LISAECNVTFSEVIDVCREKSDHNATKISLQIQITYKKSYIANKYLEMAKECIPTKVVNIHRTDKPWFNSEIRHHIRIRDRLHRKLKSSPTVHNRNIYKIRRN
jgi:hypothetical protein